MRLPINHQWVHEESHHPVRDRRPSFFQPCNTLQHPAIPCDTLRPCNTLQYPASTPTAAATTATTTTTIGGLVADALVAKPSWPGAGDGAQDNPPRQPARTPPKTAPKITPQDSPPRQPTRTTRQDKPPRKPVLAGTRSDTNLLGNSGPRGPPSTQNVAFVLRKRSDTCNQR
eukprot:9467116-Pyramimonas_sp.AAC.1